MPRGTLAFFSMAKLKRPQSKPSKAIGKNHNFYLFEWKPIALFIFHLFFMAILMCDCIIINKKPLDAQAMLTKNSLI